MLEYVFLQIVKLINLIRKGNLFEVQEFLNQNPLINISANNEYAFRYASRNYHLEIVNWLLSIKPDINISVDDEIKPDW